MGLLHCSLDLEDINCLGCKGNTSLQCWGHEYMHLILVLGHEAPWEANSVGKN